MIQNKKLKPKEEDISTKNTSSIDHDHGQEKPIIKDHQEKEIKQTLSKVPKLDIEKDGKLTIFKINAPQAKKVDLGGDFNNWNYKNTSLMKDHETDIWKKEIFIKPGRYEYKFIIDGNWLIDPNNIKKTWNTFGSENSVIEIK